MYFNSCKARLLASGVALAAAGVTSSAFAQDAAPQTAEEVGEIVVTGSRIRQANLTTTSPVTQVTSEDIAVAGVSRIEDLVTQLPQAFAAQNSNV